MKNIDFKFIEYLIDGNSKQQLAYLELKKLKIFENLKKHAPILTGTIPIGIDLPNSDLDIICKCDNHEEFAEILQKSYGSQEGFLVETHFYLGIKCTIANFNTKSFPIEIFGQSIPTPQQNAYLHMIKEWEILNKMGNKFRAEIIALKQQGMKTEPAFAKLLKLEGSPYEALLKYAL